MANTDLRQQAVLAAINTTPPREGETPEEYDLRVQERSTNIYMMLGDRSPAMENLKMLDECQIFVGEVLSIKKEKSSTRGLITLEVPVGKHSKDGRQQVRTDRTDNPKGESLAKKIQSLRGRRVLLWRLSEEIKSGANAGNKTSVIKHVQDLGEARGFN